MATPLKSISSLRGIQELGNIFPGESAPISSYGPSLGSFTAEGAFNPSPETARLLQYLEQREGKKINIKPFSSLTEQNVKPPYDSYGVYAGQAKKGGSSDPTERTVYINEKIPENNIAILAHELGHAFDPRLGDEWAALTSANRARMGSLEKTSTARDPLGFLNNYILGPEMKVRLETEAQRAATENLRNIGYPTRNFTSDPWYKGYPGSFVNTGLDQSALLYSYPENIPQGLPERMRDKTIEANLSSLGGGQATVYSRIPALGPDDPEINLEPEITRGLLQLGLNKKYRRAEERIKERNKQYIESRLGGQ